MLRKTLTLIAFLFSAELTKRADAFGMFSGANDEVADGLIELDMHIQ